MRRLLLFVFATLTMVAQAAEVSEELQKINISIDATSSTTPQ
jgi:hypothetical protein